MNMWLLFLTAIFSQHIIQLFQIRALLYGKKENCIGKFGVDINRECPAGENSPSIPVVFIQILQYILSPPPPHCAVPDLLSNIYGCAYSTGYTMNIFSKKVLHPKYSLPVHELFPLQTIPTWECFIM